MYQAFSMIVSFIALAIVSSSALFITGNNKNIDIIKNQTSKLNDQVISQNELTKKQILSLINNVNDNDAKIMNQHKNIRKAMKEVEKESKSRTENVDSRLRSFKNITNANVIGITDTVATNNRNINKKVDNLTKAVNNNKVEVDGRIEDIKLDYDDLNTRHQALNNEYYNNKTTVNDALSAERKYTDSKNSEVMGFVNDKFTKFAETNIQMDDAAKQVMNDIKDLTVKRMNTLENNYITADNRLNKKINDKDATYKSQFLYTTALKDQVNAKFFANQTFDFGGLIEKTKANENDIASVNKYITDNDKKIENIKKDYVKTTDLSYKINNAMPTTDIYKDVETNKTKLTNLDDKVKKNMDTIDENNKELKNMLKGITGGLSGEISLKDLNDRIAKNAENIKVSAAQNNREMMREVKKETEGLGVKIQSNTDNISKKLDNDKNEYTKAFKEYISDDDLVTKMKNKPIEAQSIKLNEANIDKELIVNGTKFSTVVKNLENVVGSIKGIGKPKIPRYDRDFTSGNNNISPNRTVKFRNEDTKLEMKDTALNLDDTDFSMENGSMSLLNSTLNWNTYGNNKVNMTSDGVNLNSTNVKLKDFSQLKANDQNLPQFVDSQIQKFQSSSDSSLGGQLSSYLEKNDLNNSKSITTPRLFIGNQYSSMNVKDEIENLKKSTINSQAINQARQEAMYFSKQKPNDLHQVVRTDFRDNYDKYLPNNVVVGSVQADKVLGVNEMALNNGGENGLNNIKLNGQGLKTVLDRFYESKGTTENAMSKANLSVQSINVVNNQLLLTYTNGSTSTLDLPSPNSRDDPIVDVEIDTANNKLRIRRKSNRYSAYDLPDYVSQVDLSPYATKSEYAPNYKKDQGNVVYLDNTKKSRLDSILSNDNIKNLGTTTIPSNTDVTKVIDNVNIIDSKIKSAERNINNLKAQQLQNSGNVNLTKMNEYTKNNSTKSDNYIALNSSVSLKAADNNRLQMCQSFRDGKPSDCHDLWTTKDIQQIDTRKINYS